MITIEQIKQFIEEETSKGNLEPYKQIYSFCVKIYKRLNKDKVSLWNDTRYKKIKGYPKSNNKIKGNTEKDIKGNPLNKDSSITEETKKDIKEINKIFPLNSEEEVKK